MSLFFKKQNKILTKGLKKVITTIVLSLLALIMLFPLIFTVTNSFMSESEINSNYSIVTSGSSEEGIDENAAKYANLKLIPDMATIEQYYTALVKKLQFLIMFWNSVKLVVPIILGQLLVASMAAYAFAKLSFIGRDKLFFLYIIVMLMPFQVTLVPNYIIADKLGLIGSYLSIIFPGIFSAFGVFLLRQFMTCIPNEYIEAAKVDGASQWSIFSRIIIPMSKAGLAALTILVFIDNWNMVEQPLIFIQDINKQPLSIFLSRINSGETGIAFAAAAIYMAPMLLVFFYSEDYLVQGIQLSGLKG